MFDELKYIELSGKKYPIKCDLLVVEKIQDKYENINDFENGLLTWEPILDDDGNPVYETKEDGFQRIKVRGKFPKVKQVNDALFWFACEGEAIAAELEKRRPVKIERDNIIRSVDISLVRLANQLYDEFFRCFNLKNVKTTQETETTQEI